MLRMMRMVDAVSVSVAVMATTLSACFIYKPAACDQLQTWQMILRGDYDAENAVEFVYRGVG